MPIAKARSGEKQMAKNNKKKYEKPRLTKITLDPETAVLGKCKNTGMTGPRGAHCGLPAPVCREPGS
jgi:hypothetical protein